MSRILVEKLNVFSLDYLFCKSDAFQAFGKRRITVVGKLLVCDNEIKDSLMTSSDHLSVMTLHLTIAFAFEQKLFSTQP